MAKYINLDKLNDILHADQREAFTKHQVWLLLNYHPELVIEINKDDHEEKSKPQTNPLIGRSVMTKKDKEVHIVTNVITFEEDTFGQGNFAVETRDGLYLYECEIEILTGSQLNSEV